MFGLIEVALRFKMEVFFLRNHQKYTIIGDYNRQKYTIFGDYDKKNVISVLTK